MTLPFDARALWERVLTWYNGYSERDRRWILGIVIFAGFSLVYLVIVDPILEYRKDVGRQIAEGQEELERSMRFVGAKDTLRAEREDLRKRLAQAKARLLPGGTATLGAAALQERANALASEKGIAVQSTQVMKEENVDPFRKVAVRLTLSGELKPLADFVSGVEYGQQLNVPFVEINRRGAVAGAKGPRTLSVTVEVSGFVQGGAASKTEGAEGEPVPTVEAQADAAAAGAEGAPTPSVDAAAAGEGAPPPGAVSPPNGGAPPPLGTPPPDAGPPPPGAPTPPAPGPGTGAAASPGALPGAAPPTGSPTTPTTVPPAAAGSTVSTLAGASTIVPITFPPMAFPTTPTPTVPPSTASKPTTPEPDEDGE